MNIFSLEQKLARMNSAVGDKQGVDCPICLNKGIVYKLVKNEFEDEELVAADCECVVMRKIYHTIQKSGLSDQFEKQTLSSFSTTTDWQRGIIRKAVDFLAEESNHWFYISGQVGAGKTHICTAISKELIDKGKSFKYIRYATDFIALQRKLKSGYTDVRESAEYELKELLNVDVLYIDDLLKINDYNNLFELIDGRYIRDNITIISSELSLREITNIDAAIGTRIFHKATSKYSINIEKDNSKNYRLRS